jgi:hypothetical protein
MKDQLDKLEQEKAKKRMPGKSMVGKKKSEIREEKQEEKPEEKPEEKQVKTERDALTTTLRHQIQTSTERFMDDVSADVPPTCCNFCTISPATHSLSLTFTHLHSLFVQVMDDDEVFESFFDLDPSNRSSPWNKALKRFREHATEIMNLGHTMLQRQVQISPAATS